MILDTSAVLAVLFAEPDAERIATAIGRAGAAGIVGIGAPTLVEAGIVLGATLGFEQRLLHRFLQEAKVTVVPFGEAHWQVAVTAYERFGRGRHPAALNFGDCLAYAAAKLARQPLLCKGNDFPQTDLELAPY